MKKTAVLLDARARTSMRPIRLGRMVAAVAIGNMLEWYDFSIFAFFAIYIARNFFPESDANTQFIAAFMAFGVGFIARPVGALMIGVYGDRSGRKAALILTLLLMATGTAIIAATPHYAAIGIVAPVLILLGRLLQGFSAGGDMGSAVAFLVEHAPPGRKGRYASWVQASMAASNVVVVLVAALVMLSLSSEQIGDWGWRVPFIVGAVIAPVGIWLRKTLNETPRFRAQAARAQREHAVKKAPFWQVIREYPRALVIGTGFSVLWVGSVYSLLFYMPTHAHRVLHFNGSDVFVASVIGNCLMTVICVYSGDWSDRFGRRIVLASGGALMVVSVYPLLHWLRDVHTLAALIVVQSTFCMIVGFFVGTAPAALSELFPTRFRATGTSLSYNLAATTFGGFAPAILTWLSGRTQSAFAPAWYVMVAGVIGLAAIAALPSSPRTVE